MQDATKMRVHRNGVPQHVQVHVHPGGVAVDYLDSEDRVVASAVHDASSIAMIAQQKGLEVEEVDHGGEEVKPPTHIAAETNAADRNEGGSEEIEIPEGKVEEVNDWIGDDPVRAQAVLDSDEDRVTVLDHANSVVAGE